MPHAHAWLRLWGETLTCTSTISQLIYMTLIFIKIQGMKWWIGLLGLVKSCIIYTILYSYKLYIKPAAGQISANRLPESGTDFEVEHLELTAWSWSASRPSGSASGWSLVLIRGLLKPCIAIKSALFRIKLMRSFLSFAHYENEWTSTDLLKLLTEFRSTDYNNKQLACV